MKLSGFGWYLTASSHDNTQELRRNGIGGPLYATVAQHDDLSWAARINLHLADHERMECDSELEAILAAEVWLDELIPITAPP
jgi:hypothetical protein